MQLSVYTMKDGKFLEVIVDHKTGKVAKAESITGGDDLTAAKAQAEAMAKAKSSLHIVASKAVADNSGSQAVSITPSLKEGHPVAEVILVKNDHFNKISLPLDYSEIACGRCLGSASKIHPEDREYASQIADSECEVRCPSVVLGYPCREWSDNADTVGSSRW